MASAPLKGVWRTPVARQGGRAAGQRLGSGRRNRARSRAGFGSAGSAELGRRLWRTPVNSLSHMSVKKSTLCGALPRYTERQTDRQTRQQQAWPPASADTSHAGGDSQARRVRPSERAGGLAEAAADTQRSPSAGEAAEWRQVPPRGAEAPGSASAHLRWGHRLRGAVAGLCREAKPGSWGGSGAEAQSPLLAAPRAGGRGPGNSSGAGVECLAVRC